MGKKGVVRMNDENEKIITTTDRGGEMTDNSRQDLKEIVKAYYGKPTLTPEEVRLQRSRKRNIGISEN